LSTSTLPASSSNAGNVDDAGNVNVDVVGVDLPALLEDSTRPVKTLFVNKIKRIEGGGLP
jgi:hypothetical protein